MSRIVVAPDALGNGYFTITSPNSNTNQTFALPDESGTLALTSNTFGVRNKIINGKMDVSQRGTVFNGAANSSYTADRWQHLANSAAIINASVVSDTPNDTFQYSLRYSVATADTSIAAGEYVAMRQPIEGFNIRDLIGQTFTLSFWVRSPKTGQHYVALGNDGGDRSYVMPYTVNAANTWEKKTATVQGGLITSGTWQWGKGRGLTVAFTLAAGTTFQTGSSNTWVTGNFLAGSGQVNCVDTVDAVFAITGVQLEAGSQATSFEHRPVGFELDLCQRYYEISRINIVGYATTGTSVGTTAYYKEKRIVPSIFWGTEIVSSNATARNIDPVAINSLRAYVNSVSSNMVVYSCDIVISAEL